VFIASLGPIQSARAQSVFDDRALAPGVTEAHLDRAEAVFDLSPEQRDLLDAAHAEYLSQVAELAERMRSIRTRAIEDFQQTQDAGVWRDLLEVAERFEAQRARLDRRFLGDLRVLLSGEQEAAWAGFERDRRRMTALGRGGLVAGDSVDLIALAEEAGADTVDDAAPWAGVLRSYSAAMDEAARALEDKRREIDRRAAEALQDLDISSPEAAARQFQPILDERLALAVAVRDVNKAFASRIERALPGAVGERFGELFRERVYPKVYRESTAERMARAVRERLLAEDDGGGVPDVVGRFERVELVMERYRASRGPLDEAWVGAIDEAEASGTVEGLIGGMSAESAALRDAWRARRLLDMRAARELRGLAEGWFGSAWRAPEPASAGSGRAGEGSREGADRVETDA